MIQHIFSKDNMRKVHLLSALFFLGLIVNSCKKEGELTPEFEENNASVYFHDTNTIKSFTVKDDSILTSKTTRSLIGIYHDSVFGEVKSSFFSRLSMVGTNLNFGAPSVLRVDSVVFALKYSQYYGTQDAQNIELFELTEDMNDDGSYYSNDSIAFSSSPIGNTTFTPTLDSTYISGQAFPPLLRIRVDNSIGQRFLNESGQSTFTSQENFKAFFKGIHVKVTSLNNNNTARGAITYFEPTSVVSGLYVYYSDFSSGSPVSKIERWAIATDDQRFTKFEHNYSGSVVQSVLDGSSNDGSVTYSQAMAGVKTLIKIPFVKNLTEVLERPIINQAEIVIPAVQSTINQYGYPAKMILIAADSSGSGGVFLPDFFVSEAYYGGVYDETTKDYRFNITRHIHNVVNKNRADYGLYLLVSGTSVSAGRVIIKNQTNNLEGIKLNLTYSTTE